VASLIGVDWMFVISTNGVADVVGVHCFEVGVEVVFFAEVLGFLGGLTYRSLVCKMDFLFALFELVISS
jgi:hypothetical protein